LHRAMLLPASARSIWSLGSDRSTMALSSQFSKPGSWDLFRGHVNLLAHTAVLKFGKMTMITFYSCTRMNELKITVAAYPCSTHQVQSHTRLSSLLHSLIYCSVRINNSSILYGTRGKHPFEAYVSYVPWNIPISFESCLTTLLQYSSDV